MESVAVFYVVRRRIELPGTSLVTIVAQCESIFFSNRLLRVNNKGNSIPAKLADKCEW